MAKISDSQNLSVKYRQKLPEKYRQKECSSSCSCSRRMPNNYGINREIVSSYSNSENITDFE